MRAMASACTTVVARHQAASCSCRGPWPVAARRAPLPAGRRRAAAAGRAAALADSRDSEAEDEEWGYGEWEEDERGWREPVKRMDFVYMSPEEQAAAEAELEAAFQTGMKEYAELQEWLLFRTWRFGLLFSGYLLIAASGEAAFCELLGSAVGYGYFKWLISDISKLQPGDRIPSVEADKVKPKLSRGVAKLFAAYQQALKPRLLLLPALLAAAAAYNSGAAPEDQLGLVEQGCLLGGFLSYKVALVLKIYEDLKPKPLTQADILRQQRPVLVQVDDVKLDLREVAKRAEERQQQQQQQGQQQEQQQEQQPRQ